MVFDVTDILPYILFFVSTVSSSCASLSPWHLLFPPLLFISPSFLGDLPVTFSDLFSFLIIFLFHVNAFCSHIGFEPIPLLHRSVQHQRTPITCNFDQELKVAFYYSGGESMPQLLWCGLMLFRCYWFDYHRCRYGACVRVRVCVRSFVRSFVCRFIFCLCMCVFELYNLSYGPSPFPPSPLTPTPPTLTTLPSQRHFVLYKRDGWCCWRERIQKMFHNEFLTRLCGARAINKAGCALYLVNYEGMLELCWGIIMCFAIQLIHAKCAFLNWLCAFDNGNRNDYTPGINDKDNNVYICIVALECHLSKDYLWSIFIM